MLFYIFFKNPFFFGDDSQRRTRNQSDKTGLRFPCNMSLLNRLVQTAIGVFNKKITFENVDLYSVLQELLPKDAIHDTIEARINLDIAHKTYWIS